MKIGDTVRLNSGGPLMTIVDVDRKNITGPQQAKCEWFVGPSRASETFPTACLKLEEKR